MPTYIITCDAAATVRETWRVDSAAPMTRRALIEAFHNCAMGLSIECVAEETDDEHDRVIVSVCDQDNNPIIDANGGER